MAELLRVVALLRGRLKPVEFRLRPGERGLSLFAVADDPNPQSVMEAVREVGKKGDLAIAVLQVADLHSLGLIVVFTPGGTLVEKVNQLHREACFRWWRRLWLRLTFRDPVTYFNDNLCSRIFAFARVWEEGDQP